MIKYIKLNESQSGQVARIHLKSFPNFFLSTLGFSFLNTYYKSCIKFEEAISICAFDNETKKVIGFAVGCIKSRGFNKRLIYSNLTSFICQAIVLLFTKPLTLIRLVKNLEKVNSINDKGNYAELLSIGVLPDQSRLGIGQNLLSAFETILKEKKIKSIALTTDAVSNDKVLNFYKKSGYLVYYDFITFPKRKMLKLIKEL